MAAFRVGLFSLNTQRDRAARFAAIERLVGEAAERGVRFVMLPEGGVVIQTLGGA